MKIRGCVLERIMCSEIQGGLLKIGENSKLIRERELVQEMTKWGEFIPPRRRNFACGGEV